MPIGIPLMQRRMLAGNSFEAGEEGFVPPHLVEQEVRLQTGRRQDLPGPLRAELSQVHGCAVQLVAVL